MYRETSCACIYVTRRFDGSSHQDLCHHVVTVELTTECVSPVGTQYMSAPTAFRTATIAAKSTPAAVAQQLLTEQDRV